MRVDQDVERISINKNIQMIKIGKKKKTWSFNFVLSPPHKYILNISAWGQI